MVHNVYCEEVYNALHMTGLIVSDAAATPWTFGSTDKRKSFSFFLSSVALHRQEEKPGPSC